LILFPNVNKHTDKSSMLKLYGLTLRMALASIF